MWDGQQLGCNLRDSLLQALGFNCVRVPFSFQSLFKGQPNSVTKYCNAVSQADLKANLSPPNTKIDSSLKLPGQVRHPLLAKPVTQKAQREVQAV